MSGFLRAYRYVNILSLDTALGAVVCAVFFARLVAANVWLYGKVALGLTVWIIYTADHLIDAKKVRGEASSERHRFHQKHFRALLLIMTAAVVIDLMMVINMRKSLLQYGILLSGVVGLYLLISRYLKMLKEVFIALIYTLGVMLPALADREHLMDQSDAFFMVNFFLVAVVNLLIFSWFDVDKDSADGHPSFVTFYGRKHTKSIIYGLSATIATGIIYLWVILAYEILPLIIITFMMVVLLSLIQAPRQFEKSDRYRLAGDAVFFLPVIYLLAESIQR